MLCLSIFFDLPQERGLDVPCQTLELRPPHLAGGESLCTATTHFNDGTGPDPYPSPGGAFPFTAAEAQTHSCMVAGTFIIELTVTDDDGGSIVIPFNISLG